MDLDQNQKLRKYIKVSLILHGVLFALMFLGPHLFPSSPLLFQPTVQIDMVALPDVVKSENNNTLDTSLPVKDAPPPEPKNAEDPDKADGIRAPKVDSKKEMEQQAKKALERIREAQKKEKNESERKQQELLSKRQEDLKRFEQTYRAALKGNQLNQGTSTSGALQETVNAYAGHIREKLNSNWALPVWLQAKGLRAVVRIYLDSRGNILRYQFMRGSGNEAFDNYVKGAMQKSSPFAPPPEEMAKGLRNSGLEVQFPL